MVVTPWGKDDDTSAKVKSGKQLTLGETMRRYREHRQGPSRAACAKEEAAQIVTPVMKEKKKEDTKDERWSWMVDRRDIHGKRPNEDGFDPRTLYIPEEALKSMTAFQRQYWGIKMHAMDLLLFVRVGSFYELYDIDADVGLRIGLKLVGGGVNHANFWKCGCRASSFNWWARKCISLGYRVGRVEEIRDTAKATRNVVDRRLVQVYTSGTFDMSCWNEAQGDEEEVANPLIFCLYEDECSGMLGGCLVNTISAKIEVAEWQEVDTARSTLVSILEECNPMEIVVASQKNLSMDTRRALSRYRPMVSSGIDGECNVSFLRTGCDVDKTTLPGLEEVRETIDTLMQDLGGSRKDFGHAMNTLLEGKDVAMRALLVCLYHVKATGCAFGILKRAALEMMAPFCEMGRTGHMLLNATSLKNLEIHQGSLGTKEGSLYEFLSSKACTGMGRRCVRTWLSHPLTSLPDIEARLDAVDALKQYDVSDLMQTLSTLPDVEKMMPYVAHQLSLLNLDDEQESMLLLSTGMQHPSEKERVIYWGQIQVFSIVVHNLLYFVESLRTFMQASGDEILGSLPVFQKLISSATEAKSILLPISGSLPLPSTDLKKEDPVSLPEGIWYAIDEHMVSYRQSQDALQEHANLLISMVSQRWSGPSRVLKAIKLTGVGESIGLVCPKSLEDHILQHLNWEPHERTRSGFLYKDDVLVHLAVRVEETRRQYNLGVNQAMSVLGNLFLGDYGTLLTFCQKIGELDALLSFSRVCQDYGQQLQFTRPRFSSEISTNPCLRLTNAWNPQILSSLHVTMEEGIPHIVPNSISLGGTSPSTALISGANSGGKTTFLKTVAIAAVMSQIGCYIPCSDSMIDMVNCIMTRLGARDRIQAGESTFAIEMKETSAILNQVDSYSLAIIDELGRGTAPREGEAIAWASLKALSGSKCRTLFATHFHDLNKDFEPFPNLVSLYHLKIPRGNGPEFHHDRFMLFSGPAPDDSTGGMFCALHAGIPTCVVERASEISGYLRHTYGRYQSIESRYLQDSIRLVRQVASSSHQKDVPQRITKLQQGILDSMLVMGMHPL